eukprot:scaffold104696_cov48-Phaeocystis_antarctica.AAC.2
MSARLKSHPLHSASTGRCGILADMASCQRSKVASCSAAKVYLRPSTMTSSLRQPGWPMSQMPMAAWGSK